MVEYLKLKKYYQETALMKELMKYNPPSGLKHTFIKITLYSD